MAFSSTLHNTHHALVHRQLTLVANGRRPALPAGADESDSVRVNPLLQLIYGIPPFVFVDVMATNITFGIAFVADLFDRYSIQPPMIDHRNTLRLAIVLAVDEEHLRAHHLDHRFGQCTFFFFACISCTTLGLETQFNLLRTCRCFFFTPASRTKHTEARAASAASMACSSDAARIAALASVPQWTASFGGSSFGASYHSCAHSNCKVFFLQFFSIHLAPVRALNHADITSIFSRYNRAEANNFTLYADGLRGGHSIQASHYSGMDAVVASISFGA